MVIRMYKTIPIEMEADPLVGARKSQKNSMLGVRAKTLDWDKVVDILIDKDIYSAYVGLAEDFFHTKGHLIDDYEPITEGYNSTYGICMSSMWATPCVYDDVRGVAYECYRELDDDESASESMSYWWYGDSLEKYEQRRKKI